MSISVDTWAVVLATFVGPVAAVGITFIRENRKSVRDRRMFVFRSLMATRGQQISPDHVNALNLVEIEFYRCDKIEQAWKEYKAHLDTDSAMPGWQDRKNKLLAKMLSEMGKLLGFKYDTLEIFQGGYAPMGWLHRDAQNMAAMNFVYQLSEGTTALPIKIVGPPPASTPQAQPPGHPPTAP